MNDSVQVLVIAEFDSLRAQHSLRGLSEKFVVIQAGTVALGEKKLMNADFQLVLLDLSAPGADSDRSLAHLFKAGGEVPVIVLGDKCDSSKTTNAMRLGAADCVVKDCQCNSLARTMERVLERKQIMVDAELRRARLKEEKEQLVSHLSHECRNALACIHQFGNILVDGLAGEMSQEQREYIGIMLENSSRIRSVLDGLLEAAPGEARTVC